MSSTTPNSPANDPASTSGTLFDPAQAIKAAMDKVVMTGIEKYPRPMPVIKMNLRYKPMEHITKAPFYIKYTPKVYQDALNFNFSELDYALVENDKAFIRDLNSKIVNGTIVIPSRVPGQSQTIKQEPLTETEFERVIDCIDKIY